MKRKNAFFRLMVIGCIFLFGQCKKDSEADVLLPPAGDRESWVDDSQKDIKALEAIVKAIEGQVPVQSFDVLSEVVHLHFLDGSSAEVLLDNANYPSPLIGAHAIDNRYYWSVINGTGTSSVRLLKDKDRNSYPVDENVLPRLNVNNKGNWTVETAGQQEELYDSDGVLFKAIGRKSLFSTITFDIDSNATIKSNESADKNYFIPRYRPFTLLLGKSDADTLKIASGFTIMMDFQQVGVSDMDFEVPRGWSVDYELDANSKSGILQVTSPTGMEAEFEDRGAILIKARDEYGRMLMRKIPVRVEVGLVNFASVILTDVANGIEITGAKFVFSESITSTNEKEVSAVKAGSTYRLMMPDGYPQLRKATFVTATMESFEYYFEPNTFLTIGEQNLSIVPPNLLSYWKGGMIVHIDQTLPLTGLSSYKITGKVVHVSTSPSTIRWFPNANAIANVIGANSDTNGAANTAAIITALGGPGTTNSDIARWAIRVREGGYGDWYLGAVLDYHYFHALWSPNKRDLLNARIAQLGGDIVLGTTNQFWTSTNINKDQAKTYHAGLADPISTGTKIYGLRGMAYRNF